jgi:hypothetical protein
VLQASIGTVLPHYVELRIAEERRDYLGHKTRWIRLASEGFWQLRLFQHPLFSKCESIARLLYCDRDTNTYFGELQNEEVRFSFFHTMDFPHVFEVVSAFVAVGVAVVLFWLFGIL